MEKEKEKKIGSTMKERTGDWVITFECIGYVNGHNVWQEKKRTYDPHPYLRDAVADIERDRDMSYLKELRRVAL